MARVHRRKLQDIAPSDSTVSRAAWRLLVRIVIDFA